jgi:hypothetical protein
MLFPRWRSRHDPDTFVAGGHAGAPPRWPLVVILLPEMWVALPGMLGACGMAWIRRPTRCRARRRRRVHAGLGARHAA